MHMVLMIYKTGSSFKSDVCVCESCAYVFHTENITRRRVFSCRWAFLISSLYISYQKLCEIKILRFKICGRLFCILLIDCHQLIFIDRYQLLTSGSILSKLVYSKTVYYMSTTIYTL